MKQVAIDFVVVLTHFGCWPADGQPFAVHDGESTRIADGTAGPVVSDLLPERARVELRIPMDVFG
jgi:hypothetical protein